MWRYRKIINIKVIKISPTKHVFIPFHFKNHLHLYFSCHLFVPLLVSQIFYLRFPDHTNIYPQSYFNTLRQKMAHVHPDSELNSEHWAWTLKLSGLRSKQGIQLCLEEFHVCLCLICHLHSGLLGENIEYEWNPVDAELLIISTSTLLLCDWTRQKPYIAKCIPTWP